MNLATTLLFYLVIGAAVSLAALLGDQRPTRFARLISAFGVALFWPLFVPVLLAGRSDRGGRRDLSPAEEHRAKHAFSPAATVPMHPPREPEDALRREIEEVDRELDAAVASLDGWAGHVLAQEGDRFDALRSAWRSQAAQIRELDALLAHPSFQIRDRESLGESREVVDERCHASRLARRENIERLWAVRNDRLRELLSTLAWVRDLVTQIHLARYTGAPAARAEELVGQIAAAVEGLSEVSNWRSREANRLWPDPTWPEGRTGDAPTEPMLDSVLHAGGPS
ncbi:MAG: hypothetical protein AB7F89_01045 [Pirellulaceae bacterium]